MFRRDPALPAADRLRRLLHTMRKHLGMEAAFISELTPQEQIYRYVDCDSGSPAALREGGAMPVHLSVCRRVVDGAIPSLVQDVARTPEAAALMGLHNMRSQISVPVRLGDGSLYGSLCSFSARAHEDLNERDLNLVRMLADLAAQEIEAELVQRAQAEQARARVHDLFAHGSFHPVFQPIVRLSTGAVVGYEALTRFTATPSRSPDAWFGEAHAAGLGAELEFAAARRALETFSHSPSGPYLSVNLSPAALLADGLADLLQGVPLERIIIEVTEHVLVPAYQPLLAALGPWRERGLRLAVDDAGSGYASFRHILSLGPELIKLDMSLTQDVDKNRSHRALAAALIRFAEETSCAIVAEGIETQAQREALVDLGATYGQGYLFGKPGPLSG